MEKIVMHNTRWNYIVCLRELWRVMDSYINKTSGISEKLEFGDNLIADRGFNISDLFGNKGSKLIISPFLRDKNTFSKQNL